MKKIIKPAEREEAVHFSDFSGKPFPGCFGPDVTLKLSFNYGSKYDQTDLTLDLTDEDVRPLLALIKRSITEDFKQHLKRKLATQENNYEQSIRFRDWEGCEYTCNNMSFLKELLGLTEQETDVE